MAILLGCRAIQSKVLATGPGKTGQPEFSALQHRAPRACRISDPPPRLRHQGPHCGIRGIADNIASRWRPY